MSVRTGSADLDTFVEEWEAWHRDVEAWLADPHGFLAITSLHWLSETPQSFSDAAGIWSAGEDGVIVELGDDEELVIEGQPVRGGYSFGIIPERGGVNASWGDAVLEVAKRGGHDILRPRHPNSALRLAYHGTPAYPPHSRWRVPGHYVEFDRPRPTCVAAAVEGLEHVYESPGRIDFQLNGRQLSLTAFPGYTPRGLMVLFTDATSGRTTYSSVRGLLVEEPDADGAVVLDFNRATNPPCAYTDLATCPLPPAENRLPVAIEAGERVPYERLG